ncbi:MAG: MurR/RpiR family transcriptional regulator [Thomasclavelia sp.]|nr:MurR/RpiR family transcriptional regulator [Thomasclavelia sp.]
MGDVLLARILKYLNGALIINDGYRFSEFFVLHYNHFDKYSLEDVSKMTGIKPKAILEFLTHLGFDSYDEFLARWNSDVILRTDQIRARMIGLDINEYIEKLNVEDKDQFTMQIKTVTEKIKDAKRIIIVGALYPMSIAVELQTDLITFGEAVFQFHSFDEHLRFRKGDYVIFISATGRSMESFLYERKDMSLDECESLLITQNKTYLDKKITNETLRVLGTFDGITFNYQIMIVFDLIRIIYYKEYHYI